MWPTTSEPDDGAMYNWHYDIPTNPTGLAGLSSRQRSERAAWRTAIRQALSGSWSGEPQPARADTDRDGGTKIDRGMDTVSPDRPGRQRQSSEDLVTAEPASEVDAAVVTAGSTGREPVSSAC